MARGSRRRHCKLCDRHVDACGALSARGKCLDCGIARVTENIIQIHGGEGPYYQAWRLRILTAFGGVPVDEPPESR